MLCLSDGRFLSGVPLKITIQQSTSHINPNFQDTKPVGYTQGPKDKLWTNKKQIQQEVRADLWIAISTSWPSANKPTGSSGESFYPFPFAIFLFSLDQMVVPHSHWYSCVEWGTVRVKTRHNDFGRAWIATSSYQLQSTNHWATTHTEGHHSKWHLPW